MSSIAISRFQPMLLMYLLKQTLLDQESNQISIMQEEIGSLLFREIATEVIKNGESAVLKLSKLVYLVVKTKEGSVANRVMRKIRELFKDDDKIAIIGNTLLNNQLTDLINA